jgi:hypothetical protein
MDFTEETLHVLLIFRENISGQWFSSFVDKLDCGYVVVF